MKVGILNRIGAWNLKIFFSISLGIHLLFLSITYILFPDFRIDRLSTFNIEVSLLPLMAEEKQVKTQIKKEEKRLLQKEKKEESTHKKKLEPESPTLVQNASTDIPNQESKPFLQHDEEEKAVNESIMTPKVGALPLDENFISGHRAASKGEDPSINFPSSSPFGEWHRDSLPKTESSEKLQIAMKNPSLSDGEILFVQPRYAENPKPLYPQEARKKGYEGEVVLRVEVLSNGRVGQVEVKKSSGHELLDRSALTTVKQWRFIPAKKRENAISLWVNIPIKFQLQ
jgi:TonB family protein